MLLKKILFIFKAMNKGGAEIRTIDLMKAMPKNKYEFHFCVLSGKSGTLDNEIKRLGGYIHYIKLDFKFPLNFMRMLKKNRIDTVHSNVLYFTGCILLLAKMAHVKGRIAHFRSNGDGKSNTYLNQMKKSILQLLIYIFSTDILAVSESTMDSVWPMRKYSRKRSKVIYNGFYPVRDENISTVRHEYKVEKDDILLLHVGRFNKAKNQMFLLDVFNELQKRNKDTNLKLLFVGNYETAYGNQCRDYINENHFINLNNVIFTGVQSNISDYYNAADIFLFPSIREGLPGSLIESIIYGNVSVASDIEPNKEIYKHFPKSVSIIKLEVNNWVEKIENIIINKEYLTSNSYKVENTPFYINNIAQKYDEIWSKY